MNRLALPLFLLCLGACTAFSAQNVSAHHPSKPNVQVAIATDDLSVGVNRFAFGIIYNGQPLSTGRPRVVFYYLKKGKATREGGAIAGFSNIARVLRNTAENSAAIALKGVYVAYPRFARAGSWGAVITLTYRMTHIILRPAFVVRSHSYSPAVGSPAPRSHNPTVAQLPATLLDSGRPPDDMHKLSIAQAIGEHRPLVVIFATPAFCESRLCGPEVQLVESIEKPFQRQGVNFIHIEVWKNANPADGYAPTFTQWHLHSEPWIFVINRKGIVVAKFEGPTPPDEIEPPLRLAMR
jgi:hypothetical protein